MRCTTRGPARTIADGRRSTVTDGSTSSTTDGTTHTVTDGTTSTITYGTATTVRTDGSSVSRLRRRGATHGHFLAGDHGSCTTTSSTTDAERRVARSTDAT